MSSETVERKNLTSGVGIGLDSSTRFRLNIKTKETETVKMFVIENPNNIVIKGNAQSPKLVVGPTDMHEVEYWEDQLDQLGIQHALVEFRKVTKTKDEFLGYGVYSDQSILSEGLMK